MNKLSNILLAVLVVVAAVSCRQPVKEESEATTKTEVKTVRVTQGYLPDYIVLSGKTVYLNKSTLVAPIGGYVTKVKFKQGDKVKKGEVIFEMQSPEAYVMKDVKGVKSKYGIIKIKAPSTGQLVGLNVVSTGVFADKGSAMCTILSSNDLKLQVNVPFEFNGYVKPGGKCKVIFPDNSATEATFLNRLAQIDELSQTEKVLASLKTKKFIPENMIVKILVDKSTEHQAQIVPKECLQTDVLMSEFWVMKLINDTIAVKVNVETGNQNHKFVEIVSPQFDENTLIISEGSYGLGDTAKVKVIK